jgi:hypothetical protein
MLVLMMGCSLGAGPAKVCRMYLLACSCDLLACSCGLHARAMTALYWGSVLCASRSQRCLDRAYIVGTTPPFKACQGRLLPTRCDDRTQLCLCPFTSATAAHMAATAAGLCPSGLKRRHWRQHASIHLRPGAGGPHPQLGDHHKPKTRGGGR